MMINKRNQKILIGLLVVGLILYMGSRKEGFFFDSLNDSLGDNHYIVSNKNGKKLISSALTPVMCDDLVFANSSALPSRPQDGWKLKRIAKGTYMFMKPMGNECLYAADNDQIRSYVQVNCPKKNLCGLDVLNNKGELDNQNDYRTYFRVVDGSGGSYIISNHNNKYVCIDKSGIKFVSSPSSNCLFNFQKV
jgi:hypothetical protein